MFKTLEWDQMPKLGEIEKEFISLGKYSLYRFEENKYFLIMHGGCPCCHGGRPSSYFILNEEGEYVETSTEQVYKALKPLEIIKFKIPERITRHYYQVKIN
jgi:hypothetical protein